MSPKRNLRSVCAQCRRCRNVSSSHSSKVSKGTKLLIQGTGVTLGWISGYYMYGGRLEKYEKERQQIVRDSVWFHVEVEDLREKMWPELRNMTWFRNVETMWSESHLKKDKERRPSDLRKNMESMWSDLSEKMWSDRKS